MGSTGGGSSGLSGGAAFGIALVTILGVVALALLVSRVYPNKKKNSEPSKASTTDSEAVAEDVMEDKSIASIALGIQ